MNKTTRPLEHSGAAGGGEGLWQLEISANKAEKNSEFLEGTVEKGTWRGTKI